MRVILKVLWRHIPDKCKPFLDDIGIKGPKDRYGDEEIFPEIRRFVWEHAQIFAGIMEDIWRSGLTISGAKSAIGMAGISIVGMVCDSEGRHPEQRKMQKILDWPTPRSVKDARGFIGICVYYRIFIVGFSVIAVPIMELFRKSAVFVWTVARQAAMDALKKLLTEAPTLITLDYSAGAGPIILSVDASTTIGWGGNLQQEQPDGRRKPARYESGVWNDAERKYDAIKLECRGLLKALKKLQFWLYGRHFLVETDAKTLVWLLNQTPNDLPNAMITRWLTYIRLFDFDVKHIAGTKNGAADALSRRGRAPEDSDEDEDVDAFFDAKLYNVSAHQGEDPNPNPIARIWLVEGVYEGEDLRIGQYLESMERPEGLTTPQFRSFPKKALGFLVRDGHLYKRGRRGSPHRRVLGTVPQRQEVIKERHDETGHRGRQGTYEHVSRRYQWKGIWDDVVQYVKSCNECQRRAKIRYEELIHPTWSITVWEKVGVDIVYLPRTKEGFSFVVFARDDLSGWVEARALERNDARSVAKFLYEDVIYRHGCPMRIVMDGGPENKGVAEALLKRHRIDRVIVSPYHPQANGLVERGHAPIVNSLAKYCKDEPERWLEYLPLALWADRVSVRRSTGYSAFILLYGRDCILPIDFTIPSWSMVDWNEVRDREDLLVARMRQLDERALNEARASAELERSRLGNKAYFDSHKRFRPTDQQLQVGDLVLMHITKLEGVRTRKMKLDDRWFGPYRIREKPADSTFYRLEELDGAHLAGTTAGNRLKRFFPRGEPEQRESTVDPSEEEDDVDDVDDIEGDVIQELDERFEEVEDVEVGQEEDAGDVDDGVKRNGPYQSREFDTQTRENTPLLTFEQRIQKSYP